MRSFVRVLEADPDLGRHVDEATLATARDQALAVVHHVPAGTLDSSWLTTDEPGHLGVLVIEGLLIRDVLLTGVVCTELVGAGDILRPWDEAAPYAPVPVEAHWTVLQSTTVAVLDRRFAAVVAPWPEITAAILGRSIMRSLWLGCLMGIGHLRRVDARLQTLFWQLAYRWGHVEADGVVMPHPFTHETLGRLIGAGRPSVTRALGDLSKQGLVIRRADGTWLLRGDPPEQVSPQRRPQATPRTER